MPFTSRFSLSFLAALLLLSLMMQGCGHRSGGFSRRDSAETGKVFEGNASWYGEKFHGRTTANGERFDMHAFTAAHKSLPFNTHIRVTDLESGRSLVLRVNDRGPYARGRVLDVSKAAAKELGFLHRGVTRVRVEILDGPAPPDAPTQATTEAPQADAGLLVIEDFSSRMWALRLYQVLEHRFPKMRIEEKEDRWRVVLHSFNSEESRQRILKDLQREGYPARLE